MKKQVVKRAPEKRFRPKRSLYTHVVEFPQTKGRTVEMIELIADGDYHSVSVRFQDKTDLEIMIEPALTFKANFYEWKRGNQRRLRHWPSIRSESL